jgi:hypothetical protein
MKLPVHVAINRCAILLISLFGSGSLAQKSEAPFSQPFQEGCCVNRAFPRPKNVSMAPVSAKRLRKALSCATNNRFVGGTRKLASNLGDQTSLRVAYYYGTFMPEQEGPALTIAVYSADGNHGVLFDVDGESARYFVENLPPLLRGPKQWRLGEINGGLASYTRLWYLAQEIGSRPRVRIPLAAIEKAKPAACHVFVEDQSSWKPEDSVGQARAPR